MTGRAAATFVVAALIGAACGTDRGDVLTPPLVSSTVAGEASDPVPGRAGVDVEQVACPDALRAEQVACGVVTVPIDRDDPDAGTTRITVAAMTGYDPGFRTPVAVLQGGPGGASSALSTWFPRQPFTQVFIDQRGAGFAGPDFDCDELDAALPRMLASVSGEASLLARDALDDCARRLDQEPVLAETDSAAHAADVVDVMAALGYDRWVVYGVSYGSTIGLEVLRDAPEGLAGAVLDGVYPPEVDTEAALGVNADRALAEVAAACSADAICRGYTGNEPLDTMVERVMSELDLEPMVVALGARDSGLGRDIDVVLDGRRFAEFTFLLLYSENRTRYLPAVIGGIDRREESAAAWLAETGTRVVVASQQANDEGTYFAVQCHDRLPFSAGPGPGLASFGSAIATASLAEDCSAWEREGGGPEVDDPVVSAVPTLLLSGRFDPITPPDFAAAVADDLERATSVEQDGRGHGIWYGDNCIARIVQSFVADPARDLDTSCAESGPSLEWARP